MAKVKVKKLDMIDEFFEWFSKLGVNIDDISKDIRDYALSDLYDRYCWNVKRGAEKRGELEYDMMCAAKIYGLIQKEI